MKLFIVDCGSSSIKGSLFTVNQHQLVELAHFSSVTFLGKEPGHLPPQSCQATIDHLHQWFEQLRPHAPYQLQFWGTEAIRKANNGSQFMNQLCQIFGGEAHLLAPEDEGRLSFEAVADKPQLFADLGGRSCEFCTYQRVTSLPFGVLWANERLANVTQLHHQLSLLLQPIQPQPLTLAGGSANVIGKMINSSTITDQQIQRLIDETCNLTVEQIQTLPHVPPDWAPNFHGTIQILTHFLNWTKAPITLSPYGWRHGLAKRILLNEPQQPGK